MHQKELEQIKSKSTTSVIFLSLRNIGIQAISTLGFFLLTILLGAGEVGLFAIVAESIGILGYFSDLGLASALIQQKDKVKKAELRTTFTIQQILVLVSLLIVAISYPSIASVKSYGQKEMWILISLCYAFFAASLKTIPSVLLERKLNFKLISTIDIIENLIFYVTAVLFAYLGFGALSYAIATFLRSTVGLVLIYKQSPWPIGFAFSKTAAKKLFKFGIPFQFNSFIAMAKDRLSSLMVAGIIGREAYGILAWAQKGPRIPLSFMDAIMKVTFPTFARLQNDPEYLKKSIQKSLFFIALFVFPALAGIASIAPDVINLIPKYQKWSPAVYPLYFYALSYAIAAVTTPITNAFNAVGKITTTTKLMIMWAALTWIFFPLLSYKYSYQGTAYATLIVGSSSFYVWYLAQKIFNVNVFKTILHPLISTLAILILLIAISMLDINLYLKLGLKLVSAVSLYTLLSYLFDKEQLQWFLHQLKAQSSKKLS